MLLLVVPERKIVYKPRAIFLCIIIVIIIICCWGILDECQSKSEVKNVLYLEQKSLSQSSSNACMQRPVVYERGWERELYRVMHCLYFLTIMSCWWCWWYPVLIFFYQKISSFFLLLYNSMCIHTQTYPKWADKFHSICIYLYTKKLK